MQAGNVCYVVEDKGTKPVSKRKVLEVIDAQNVKFVDGSTERASLCFVNYELVANYMRSVMCEGISREEERVKIANATIRRLMDDRLSIMDESKSIRDLTEMSACQTKSQ